MKKFLSTVVTTAIAFNSVIATCSYAENPFVDENDYDGATINTEYIPKDLEHAVYLVLSKEDYDDMTANPDIYTLKFMDSKPVICRDKLVVSLEPLAAAAAANGNLVSIPIYEGCEVLKLLNGPMLAINTERALLNQIGEALMDATATTTQITTTFQTTTSTSFITTLPTTMPTTLPTTLLTTPPTSTPTTTPTTSATNTTSVTTATSSTTPITSATNTTSISTTTMASATTSALKPGDINGDNIIDGRDATAILTEYARTSTGKDPQFNKEQLKAADVNEDNIFDGRDATTVLTYYAYISTCKDVTLAEFIKNSK